MRLALGHVHHLLQAQATSTLFGLMACRHIASNFEHMTLWFGANFVTINSSRLCVFFKNQNQIKKEMLTTTGI